MKKLKITATVTMTGPAILDDKEYTIENAIAGFNEYFKAAFSDFDNKEIGAKAEWTMTGEKYEDDKPEIDWAEFNKKMEAKKFENDLKREEAEKTLAENLSKAFDGSGIDVEVLKVDGGNIVNLSSKKKETLH